MRPTGDFSCTKIVSASGKLWVGGKAQIQVYILKLYDLSVILGCERIATALESGYNSVKQLWNGDHSEASVASILIEKQP